MRRTPAAQMLELVAGKALVIPPGGWTAESFAAHGQAMILALARVAKITQRRAAPELAAKAKGMFKKQVDRICHLVMEWSGSQRRAKADLELPPNSHLWEEAMNEVLAEAGIEATATILPGVQSVMAQGYHKTSLALGQEPGDVSRVVAIESRSIAARITNISETTRDRLRTVVAESIQNGLGVADTVAAVQKAAPQIYGHRALMIARTELNNAWTKGTVKSMQESESITHVSVIGCEAREPNSPQYRGESTCNIMDVPVADADQLEFHINHTGNIIPSGFRNEDGTDDDDAPRPPAIDQAQRVSDQQAED